MINREQILERLSALPIETIAGLTDFSLREGGKIQPLNFVLSCFVSFLKGDNTLEGWAKQLGILIQGTLSANGLKNALNKRREAFAKMFLEQVLLRQLTAPDKTKVSPKLLEPFNRVFLEDSSCIKLPKALYRFFKGPFSKNGKAATAKVQLRTELKSETYVHMELKSFRDNDQSFAANIVRGLKQGDLVIRDLGYWSLLVFQVIAFTGAYFLSRFRFGTNIYERGTGKEINLAKRLRKAARQGERAVELQVDLGAKRRAPVRMVAIKNPPAVTRKRRKKAAENRDKRSNHSKEYMELLGWTIFITNVDKQVLSAQNLLEVYGYRWRIEIIFKAWKSVFRFEQLFASKSSLTKERAAISIYLILAWLTLFFVKWHNFFLHAVYAKTGRFVSLMKIAKFVKEHFMELLLCPDLEVWVDHVAYYYTYSKRKKFPNFCEQLYLLN